MSAQITARKTGWKKCRSVVKGALTVGPLGGPQESQLAETTTTGGVVASEESKGWKMKGYG